MYFNQQKIPCKYVNIEENVDQVEVLSDDKIKVHKEIHVVSSGECAESLMICKSSWLFKIIIETEKRLHGVIYRIPK